MKTLAFTGGKGGVGKTTLACNMSVAMARDGARVLLFDADFGLANADTVMGVRPTCTLNDLSKGKSVNDILQATPYGVTLLPGASGVAELADLNRDGVHELLGQLRPLEDQFDYMIVDTAAGISESVMALLQASDQLVLVITPDPLSVLDAYATIKVLSKRRYQLDVKVIVNMADSEEDARRLFAKVRSIAIESLGVRMEYGGCVRRDRQFRNAVCNRVPIVASGYACDSIEDINRCAGNWRLKTSVADEVVSAVKKPSFFTKFFSLFVTEDTRETSAA